MKLPPAWKIRREVWRVKEQMHDLLIPRFADRIAQAYHDRNIHRLLLETRGSLSLTKRVAVLVLFQPKGIAASTYMTLDHLAQENWSVLLVSNTALSTSDRKQLAAKSAFVIERPNTGYDFGAYREGWRWLERHGHKPERLILMNDSSWFPLRMHDNSLRRMEALNVDLAGQVFKTESTENEGRDHLESHLLMFSEKALHHPAILRFWADYAMTSDKRLTILRGEKGLTQCARQSGLSIEGLLDREKMLALLSQLSDQKLLEVLESLAIHSEDGKKLRADWMTAARGNFSWREEFLAWTSYQLSNSRQYLVSAAFVDPAASLGGLCFLKKSNDLRFQFARLALMRGIEAGRIPPVDPLIEKEVMKAIAGWKLPFDWRAKPSDIQMAEL